MKAPKEEKDQVKKDEKEEKQDKEVKEEEEQKVEEEKEGETEEDTEEIVSVKFNLSKLSPKRIFKWYSGLDKKRKIIVTIIASILLFTAVFIPTAILLKLDSLVFPSNLEGYVLDSASTPIEDVKVCVGNKCDETDDEGFYKINGLSYGKRKVSVSKDGFQTRKEDVKLKRGENKKDFELKVQGVKDIMGRFAISSGTLIADNFKLIAGENVYDIVVEINQSFIVKDVEIQNLEIEVYSPDYLDSTHKIDPSQSEIDLGEIDLTPAADISFTPVDFLSKEDMDGLEVESNLAEDSEKDFSITKLEGVSLIEDLEIATEADFKITKDGYNPKDINIDELVQGDNIVGEFPMSETGRMVYISSRTGTSNIYIANYDGTDEERLTDNKGDNEYAYYNEQEGTVYFVSDRDQVEDENGYVIDLVYKVNVDSKKIEKVTQNDYADDGYNGIGAFNLKAMRRVYNREHPDYPDTWQIMFGHINGTGAKQLMHSADSIYNYILSDSGNLMMYTGAYSDESNNGVYLFNTQTLQQNRIYENTDSEHADPLLVSADSNYGLLREYSAGNSDLVVRDFTKAEDIQLTDNTTSENMSRFGPNNEVSYISNRDAENDIYITDLESKTEKRITEDGEVYSYAWVGDLILFVSEGQLWIVYPDYPENPYKLTINGSPAHYTNFSTDFYGWN